MITIEAWISRFCAWWLEAHGWYCSTTPPPLFIDPQYVDRAVEYAATEDREHPEPGQGEVKRHRVFAQLLKRFPDAPRRDLGLAIELAVRR